MAIDAGTLAMLRNLAADELGDTCTLIDSGMPASDGGGEAQYAPPVYREVPCGFEEVSGGAAADAVVKLRGRYQLTLKWNTPITEATAVVFQGRNYPVVWLPPVTAETVERLVGLSEVR